MEKIFSYVKILMVVFLIFSISVTYASANKLNASYNNEILKARDVISLKENTKLEFQRTPEEILKYINNVFTTTLSNRKNLASSGIRVGVTAAGIGKYMTELPLKFYKKLELIVNSDLDYEFTDDIGDKDNFIEGTQSDEKIEVGKESSEKQGEFKLTHNLPASHPKVQILSENIVAKVSFPLELTATYSKPEEVKQIIYQSCKHGAGCKCMKTNVGTFTEINKGTYRVIIKEPVSYLNIVVQLTDNNSIFKTYHFTQDEAEKYKIEITAKHARLEYSTEAIPGETVKVCVYPEEGYKYNGIESSNVNINLNSTNQDGVFTFIMLAQDIKMNLNMTKLEPDYPASAEDSGKHVVALLMNHERIPTVSGVYGTWGNSGKDMKHQPDKVLNNGFRDIASVYYPSIGLYDVTDPDYQEYMMQLCKMTYIDTLNYYISTLSEIEEGALWGENFDEVVVPMLRKYGLNSTARLENPVNSMKSEKETIEGFTNIVNKLDDTVLKINSRPVLTQFTVEGMKAQFVENWKVDYFDKYGVVPFFMLRESSAYLKGDWAKTADGFFGWVGLEDINSLGLEVSQSVGDYRHYITAKQAIKNHNLYMNRAKKLLNEGKISFYSEAVSPGFDDIAVWGWGTTPRKINRGENGELYEYKWKSAIANDAQMVNIPTWDDWGEGTVVEPTLEYGVEYLEITRKYAAIYKGIKANTASLELPGWIYKIRKTTDDKVILAKMDEASELIAKGRFDEAEALVAPYVKSTGIPATSKKFFNYPTTPTTPLVPETSEEIISPEIEDETETWKPTADTYIAETSDRGIDSGTEKKLRVKNAHKTNLTRNIYIQFDTSTTSFYGVSKATLRLYCEWASSNENEKKLRDIKLYATTTDWHEESFSWKNQPIAIEKLADVDTSTNITGKWIEIDVTEYVKYNLGRKISFSLRNEGADTEANHLDFTSREGDKNTPQLVLVKGERVEQRPPIEIKEVSITATADSYVASSGGGDKGSEQTVRMKKCDQTGRTRHTYFKFDTRTFKDSQTLKATLKIYCNYASKREEYVKMRDVNLYAVSNNWTEGGFSWEVQPKVLEKITNVDTSDYSSNEWIEIDITEYVKEHLGEVISFSLRDEGQNHEESHIDFASRESKNKPAMVLTIY